MKVKVQEGEGKGGVSLVLRVCPNCGDHGLVLIMREDRVINTLSVLTRPEALDIHAELLRGGGQEQPEFLEAVRTADYLQDEAGSSNVFGERDPFAGSDYTSMIAFGGVMIVFGEGGVMVGRVSRSARQTRRREDDPLLEADLSQASLMLEQCSCRQHGVVVLRLSTGEAYEVAFPTTKAEACDALDRLVHRYPTFPDGQEDFLQAVEAAEYLTGPMPFQLR